MFSVLQKRDIAHYVQRLLRSTGHPELPPGEIEFHLHVKGAAEWSWADIRNNGAVPTPGVNPHNEAQAAQSEEFRKALMEDPRVAVMVDRGANLYQIIAQLVADKKALVNQLAGRPTPTILVVTEHPEAGLADRVRAQLEREEALPTITKADLSVISPTKDVHRE